MAFKFTRQALRTTMIMDGANPTNLRIGHGYDIHRLQSGGTLVLCGVEVSQGMSPVAHSDGDIVLHALVDALLGAMGLGDIGQMFPNTDPRWRGVASRVFLDAVLQKVRDGGFAPMNADVTILAERPRLQEHKARMVESLGAMLGCAVNVKAGTNEGCDAIGRGEAIAAHAVVLLARTRS
jgi:2-C-methyl-D-erythritol 2,4-cyclodiphosphate synthase